MELDSLRGVDLDQEAKVREQVIFLIVLIVILVAILRLLWIPVYEKIKIKNEEIKNVKQQVEALKKFIELDKKIAPPEPKKKKGLVFQHIEKELRESSKDPRLTLSEGMQEITSRKRMRNLVLNNLSFKPPQEHVGYYVVPIMLTVQGTFSALQSYFSWLEKIDYLFTVDNIKFSVAPERPGIVVADLRSSLYIGGVIKGLGGTSGGGAKKGKKGKKGAGGTK